MSRSRDFTYLSCDFETTVYEGQTSTEVWASAVVELYTEDVKIFTSIEDTYKYFLSLDKNLICLYHNLKFDGSFWIYFLETRSGLDLAFMDYSEDGYFSGEMLRQKNMPNGSYAYSISERGQWYTISIKVNNKLIEIRDSLKLLPFSAEELGPAFNTKHRKLEMEYEGVRHAGGIITEEERAYISNDVLVVKEALEVMYDQGHNRLTIGSCCMAEFKSQFKKKEWNALFPDLYSYYIDPKIFCGCRTAGDFIRRAYRGGWCYLVKGKENKRFTNGLTADVNSLYPSVMHSESGSVYPYGEPHFWKGEIPPEALGDDKFFYVALKTRFYIRKDMLPFIQIKGSLFYDGRESLETSDIKDLETGEYCQLEDFNGTVHYARPTLYLSSVDYKLFCEHYILRETEFIGGCWFNAAAGFFDKYIDKYKEQKLKSKGALRTLAKLFLNNLYGKFSTSRDSSFKVAYIKDDGALGFKLVEEYEKTPGYIAVGAAVTSYARNFTIRAAQANYYGKKRPGFIYADTDSIHCDLAPDQIRGVTLHDKNFCCWKIESQWDFATFARQKTYIEHVTGEDLKPIDTPYYTIRAAGMPARCQDLLGKSIEGYQPGETLTDEERQWLEARHLKPINPKKYNEDERAFILARHSIEDLRPGLVVPGSLKARQIPGGVLLKRSDWVMR